MNRLLVDSSFLVALFDKSDENRARAIEFARTNRDVLIVPEVTLTEVTHILNRFVNHYAMTMFLKAFAATPFELQSITKEDIFRAYEIATAYPKAEFDFVDCCILALAERLDITRICTFDIRDFSIFKPTHCQFLELLP